MPIPKPSGPPSRRPDIILVRMGDELLLRPPDGKAIHVLNRTAQLIWDLCDGQHTEEEIAQAVRAHFAVAGERDVLADVRRTLADFAEKRLLTDIL